MKMVRTITWIAVAVVVGLLLGRSFMVGNEANDGPGGPFTLTGHTGEVVNSTDFKGRYMLIYFGYSFCPDVCPLELQKITTALLDLEAEGYDTTPIQPIFISVDPERDTVEELASYVQQFHPRLVALTGTPEAVAEVARKFRVYYKKRVEDGVEGYLMDHQSLIFVMGPDGKFLRLFSSRDKPADIETAFRPVLVKVAE